VQGPVNKTDYRTTATSFSIPGENPRGTQYWDDYTAPAAHHGIGGILINDKTGYLNRWSVYATYAYHKPLGTKTTISAGFLAGLSSVSLDRSKIVLGNLDPNDPAIGYSTGELKKLMPEVGAGLWLYGARYYIGGSVLNIIPSKVKFVNNNKYGTYFEPHFFATAGYRFFLGDDISVLPSVGVQWINPEPFQIHGNVKFQYRDNFWLGGNYRFTDALGGYAAMAGINISNTLNVSYSYDVSTNSRLRTYTRNTHEIMIGFLLNNKYSDACPRCNW
jgi:type IX secretion system PorP/SprF family membrane protein